MGAGRLTIPRRGRSGHWYPVAVLLLLAGVASAGPRINFPTANHALLEEGGGERFLVGTIGRTWESGGFGCVRSEGWQMHEGIDIAPLSRDKSDEPTDPVLATADGSVAYINDVAWKSSYGNYVILRHEIDHLEVYSLYAHLRSVPPTLKVGHSVAAGEVIGTLGRTANHSITRKRAHLHFELTFLITDKYDEWRRKAMPGTKNEHGKFTGLNLVGVDPSEVLMLQSMEGEQFSLLNYVRNQTELCRVLVREIDFPWLHRYVRLVRRNPVAEREGVVAYELSLNFNGLPFLIVPRAASEIQDAGKEKITLVHVNEEEYDRHHCRQYVRKRGGEWELTTSGMSHLELLTY